MSEGAVVETNHGGTEDTENILYKEYLRDLRVCVVRIVRPSGQTGSISKLMSAAGAECVRAPTDT